MEITEINERLTQIEIALESLKELLILALTEQPNIDEAIEAWENGNPMLLDEYIKREHRIEDLGKMK